MDGKQKGRVTGDRLGRSRRSGAGGQQCSRVVPEGAKGLCGRPAMAISRHVMMEASVGYFVVIVTIM
jgi:hypothetical protein